MVILPKNQSIIEERWSLNFGDRLNEIVFIGIQMDEKIIKEQLDNCICNERECEDFKNGTFSKADPFPVPRQHFNN
jgi:hypothetical protein